MSRLRQACPWDAQQTHRSLVQYLIEEAAETVEAIESGDQDASARGAGRPVAPSHLPCRDRGGGQPVRCRGRGPRHRGQAGRAPSVRVRRGRGARRSALHLGATQGRREGSNLSAAGASPNSCRRWLGRTRSSAGAGPGGSTSSCRTRQLPRIRSGPNCSRWSRGPRPTGSIRTRRCATPYASSSSAYARPRRPPAEATVVMTAPERRVERSGCDYRTDRGTRSRCRSSAASVPRRARRPSRRARRARRMRRRC